MRFHIYLYLSVSIVLMSCATFENKKSIFRSKNKCLNKNDIPPKIGNVSLPSNNDLKIKKTFKNFFSNFNKFCLLNGIIFAVKNVYPCNATNFQIEPYCIKEDLDYNNNFNLNETNFIFMSKDFEVKTCPLDYIFSLGNINENKEIRWEQSISTKNNKSNEKFILEYWEIEKNRILFNFILNDSNFNKTFIKLSPNKCVDLYKTTSKYKTCLFLNTSDSKTNIFLKEYGSGFIESFLTALLKNLDFKIFESSNSNNEYQYKKNFLRKLLNSDNEYHKTTNYNSTNEVEKCDFVAFEMEKFGGMDCVTIIVVGRGIYEIVYWIVFFGIFCILKYVYYSYCDKSIPFNFDPINVYERKTNTIIESYNLSINKKKINLNK